MRRSGFSYLTGIKAALGNLSNDLGFVATLLVKHYLEHFAIIDFDAAAKAQGAAGVDIEAATADGRTIAGELKTTTPYQPSILTSCPPWGRARSSPTSFSRDQSRLFD